MNPECTADHQRSYEISLAPLKLISDKCAAVYLQLSFIILKIFGPKSSGKMRNTNGNEKILNCHSEVQSLNEESGAHLAICIVQTVTSHRK